ncbi:hypothetical protein ACFW5D_33160 [Streptomyces sp. NPDC058770]|uniref:hypothetical protein n=1 Tax=Streptomyces sp. NPDC058770 TaxID=3346631 RepID=UPI0036AF7682
MLNDRLGAIFQAHYLEGVLTNVTLREVQGGDLAIFFVQMNDPEGMRRAAFAVDDPSVRASFDAHWRGCATIRG